MSRWLTAPLIAVVALAACRRGDTRSPMAGMTAEEHARMQAGASQGPMDTAGSATRQAVHLTPAQERALGVVYTVARRDTLTRHVRTVGRILPAEPAITDVTPKIDGFVEHLWVSFTGEAVRRGQPLLTIYSPMLVAAQEELLTAMRLASALDSSAGEARRNAIATLEATRRRLAYWDITPDQVARIERTGEVTKTLTLVSPVSGIVLEKHVVEGQQVMPGMSLYQIADLSRVWAEADLFEQDLQLVQVGTQSHIEVTAYPGEHLMGQVSFVYPTVDERSRTNRVRVSVANPGGRLKPGMFATVYFDVVIGTSVLAVPREAVVVTGERNLVFVRDAQGMLIPREVVLGRRAAERVEILAGLEAGETIVASANFLVDAESRLATTGGAMPGMQHGVDTASRPPRTQPEHRHD